MAFDKLLYDGGFKSVGKLKCHYRGQEHSNWDLDELLGEKWHIKGLNIAGDHAYAFRYNFFLLTEKATTRISHAISVLYHDDPLPNV